MEIRSLASFGQTRHPGVVRIDIYSDTICPWCFIGKRRLERALSERPGFDVALNWQPFQLNPDMAPEGMDRAAYLAAKFGGADRATHVYDAVLAAAEGEGLAIDLAAIRRTPNTLDSHRLIRFAKPGAAQDRVVESLFRAYFCDGRDIGDIEVLVAIAAEAGLDRQAVRAHLESDSEVSAVRAEDTRARTMGINAVPCFVLDDRYTLSGAHEPEAFFAFLELGRGTTEPSRVTAGQG